MKIPFQTVLLKGWLDFGTHLPHWDTKFMMRYQTKSRCEMGSLYKIKLYIPV